MNVARFVARYPRLYHMADAGSWASITRHGLLSTSSLLTLFEYMGERRERIESEWRPIAVEIDHPRHGRAVIRDQKPLPPTRLALRLLDGMTPSDWYRLLNGHVFFWADERRLRGFRTASMYRADPQIVMVVDTAGLLERHGDRVLVSSINSGSLLRGGAYRGAGTFVPLTDYVKRDAAEVCIPGAVPEILDLLVVAEQQSPDGSTRQLTREPEKDSARGDGRWQH